MYKLKIKIAGLYCARCAEQITNLVHKNFKIKGIELDMKDQTIVISSNTNIERGKLANEIVKKGYGPVVFITKRMYSKVAI